MTRGLTTGLAAEVQKHLMMPILLLRFGFDSGDVNIWSGVGTLVWQGVSYTGAGWLGGISTIAETGRLEANGATFTLTEIPGALIEIALAETYQGRPVIMWLGALDGTFTPIVDPYQIFTGHMDVMSIQDDGNSGTISLTVENFLLTLERPNERNYTAEDWKKINPGDTFFDFVVSILDKQVKFG